MAFGETYKTANERQRAARKISGYFGRGGYWGRKIGGMFGRADLGDKLGDLAGSAIRSLVPHGNTFMDAAVAAGNVLQGQGAYDMVDTNSLVRSVNAQRGFEIPTFAPLEDGASVRVTHREYLGDVYGPSDGNFVCTQYSINPGMRETFPWLSQCAQNYDEYDLHQCMFTFRSTTTDIGSSTNGQCGTLILATQYNASDAPFADKESMMQYDGAMSSKTTEHQMHGVECDPEKLSGSAGKYIRTGPVRNQDVKSYDHATMNLAVTGIPSGYFGQPLGELWISYTVVLRKPKYFAAKGFDTLRDIFLHANTAGTALSATPLTTLPNSWLNGYMNSIGSIIDRVNNRIVFPDNFAGAVRLRFRLVTTGGSITPGGGATLAVSTSPNIAPVSDQYAVSPTGDSPGALSYDNNGNAQGIVSFSYDMLIRPRPAGAPGAVPPSFFSFVLGNILTASTIGSVEIDIQQLNTIFNSSPTGGILLVDGAGNFVVP
jgi:hypothetical protein